MMDCAVARCPNILAFHTAHNRFFRKNYEYVGETHPFYELVYVIDGCVGITAGKDIYTLKAGQMLIHPPEEFHRIWSEAESEPHVLNLSFHASTMPPCASRVLQPQSNESDTLVEICRQIGRVLKTRTASF